MNEPREWGVVIGGFAALPGSFGSLVSRADMWSPGQLKSSTTPQVAAPRSTGNSLKKGSAWTIVLVIGLTSTAHFLRKEAEGEKVGLTGQTREKFVGDFADSCLSSQRKLAENAGLSDHLMKKYCGCVASGFADVTSVAEMRRGPPDRSVIETKVNPIAQRCQLTESDLAAASSPSKR